MVRRDHRPVPEYRAARLEFAMQVPVGWPIHHQCGYLHSTMHLTEEAGWSCSFGLTVGEALWDRVRTILPPEYFLSYIAVRTPEDPQVRCGEDRQCQRGVVAAKRHGIAEKLHFGFNPYLTWTIVGTYLDPTGATKSGQARFVLPISSAARLSPGKRTYSSADNAAWLDVINYIRDSPYLFADPYGRKCQLEDRVLLRANSFYQ